ncbi:putative oxidoreductase, SDR-family [Nocardia nova SH22a]|uniref:Putative oxidoreductase, SDR-family n=2 Tax=Nocardia nova TaxID=37330 RepID=W5TLY2_9NOCA|nr:putative oxidoreductase, SDR-family [Nocardia nova SH22a]
MPELTERSIRNLQVVITGATNGIGKEIARGVATRGARIVLLARDRPKAEGVATELTALGAAAVEIVEVDLAQLDSVRAAVIELHSRLSHIDVLVNNAGVTLFSSGRPTVDGFEPQIAINHLAPFLLTLSTLDLLRAAPSPARIIVTASEGHRHASLPDPATLAEPVRYGLLRGQLVYGQSKLLNILFTKVLARRLAGTGTTVNCFCPGVVSTGLVRGNSLVSWLWGLGERAHLLRRPEQGARMGLRLILDPGLEGVSGEFFTSTPGLRLLPPVRAMTEYELQRQIWHRSAELVGVDAETIGGESMIATVGSGHAPRSASTGMDGE